MGLARSNHDHVRHSAETIGRDSKEKVTTETTTRRSQNRHDQLCVLLICHRILFANSVYYFKGWVEKHITRDSHVTLTWHWLLRKANADVTWYAGSCWDSRSRDIGQLSYIMAREGSSKEMHSLGLSYSIMGYTTISFRRLSNFKMKLTSWVG